MSVNVILAWRSNPSSEEVVALKEKFPKKKIQFIRTEPNNFSEHIQLCDKHHADLVLLPPTAFLLSKKLEPHHPTHVGLLGGNELQMVVDIPYPIFTPYLVHN